MSQLAVVTLPIEIDISNAQQVFDQLRLALTSGVTVLVADLTGTTFCDAAGVRHLALARAAATDRHTELRLAVPAGRVRNVLGLIGPASLRPLYLSLADAREGNPPSLDPVLQSAGRDDRPVVMLAPGSGPPQAETSPPPPPP